MPFHRDSSSTGRRSRGRASSDASQASPRARDANGVIVLYADEDELRPRPAPKDLMSEDLEVAQLRADRDSALEEIAYLKEQLRSLGAYHAHLLNEERQRMLDEQTQLARELSAMREEMQRRTFPRAMATSSAGRPLATAPDGHDTATP